MLTQGLKEKISEPKAKSQKLKAKNFIPFLVIFLISLIYLHPYFLGKVDIPIDLRDLKMYPWKYHAVDQKVVNIVLWEGKYNGNKNFTLTVEPGKDKSIVLDIEPNKDKLNDLESFKNLNYYVDFDFKVTARNFAPYSFGIFLKNLKTGDSYEPKANIVPISKHDNYIWYKARFLINDFVVNLESPIKLNQYSLQLKVLNKSSSKNAVIEIKNLHLLVKDYSNVGKVNNHYLADIIQMFPPLREYFSHSLKEGRLPFWNNYILTGVEFLAEPQVGFFHPLYFLSYLIFDQFIAHAVVTFVSLCLCGIGMYLLFCYLGFALIPSLFAAIVYMFHPFNVTHFTYEHILMSSAALPFLILAYEKNLNRSELLNRYVLISGFLLGLIFLSGHLQVVYYTVLFFFLYVLFKAFCDFLSNNKCYIKHLFSVSFVFGIGLLLSGIVVIPFLEILHNSHRAPNPEGFIKSTSLPLSSFIGVLFPLYKGIPDWPMSGITSVSSSFEEYRQGFSRNYLYFGFLPFLFSLFSIRELLKKNKLVIFLFCVIVFSVLIFTGSPFFYLIKDILPGFKRMQHYRFTMLYSFAVPFLAGIGFNFVINRFNLLTKKSFRIICAVIVLITVIDLMYFSSFFVTWSKKTDYKPLYKNSVLSYLKENKISSGELYRVLSFTDEAASRVFEGESAKPNTLLPYGIETASGYSSFIPRDLYYSFFYVQTKNPDLLYSGKIFGLFPNINIPYPVTNYSSKILDLLNVKYFLVPNYLELNSGNVKKVYSSDATLYENLDYLQRAFLVHDYEVIEDPKETIIRLDSEEFDPRKTVILDKRQETIDNRQETTDKRQQTTDNRQQSVVRGLMSVVSFVKYESEHIKLKVQTNTAGFLVLGHNLNNNWHVKINGKEEKHFRANLFQRAVYLPEKGDYDIEFYYFSKRFMIGALMTLTGLLILLLLAIIRSTRQEARGKK